MEFIESVPKHGNVRPVVETVFNKSGTNISNGGERAFAKALTIDMGKGKDQVKYFICTHSIPRNFSIAWRSLVPVTSIIFILF